MKFKIAIGRIGSDIWVNIRLRGLIRELGGLKNKKILDIGCENDPYMGGYFVKSNDVTFTDLNKKNLDKVKYKNYKKILLDLTNISMFPKTKYDVIICADVMEHIKDDDIAFKNLLTLLKEDGKLIFTAPAYSWLYGVHDTKIGHYRRYDKKDLYYFAKKYKIKLIKIRFLMSLVLPIFILAQRNKKSSIFYKGKSKLESKISSLLNIFCTIDEFLRLPFGLCIMGVFQK